MSDHPHRAYWNRRGFLKAGSASVSALLLSSLTERATAQERPSIDVAGALPARETLLIRGAYVLSMDAQIGDLANSDVLVSDGQIQAVGQGLPSEGARVIDAQGMILIPGLVDTHWHMWNSLARSFVPTPAGESFASAMKKITAGYEPATAYLAVRLSAAEALHSGVTTVNNWAHNTAGPAFADAELQALRDSGLRGRFPYGSPQALASDQPMDFVDARRFAAQLEGDPLWRFGIAVRGPERTGEKVWRAEWAFARELGVPLSTHIAVTRELQKQRAIRQLERDGLLGADVQLVHATHADDDDCRAIAAAGSPVSLSPWTEMRVGYGLPPVLRLHQAGVALSLSVDNTALAGNSDFFSIMRVLINLASGMSEDSMALLPRQVLEWATLGGARDLGLADSIGSITPGKRADLLLIDARRLGTAPLTDAAAIVTQSATPADVVMVLADGREVKRDGQLTGLDQQQLVSDVERGWSTLRAKAGY